MFNELIKDKVFLFLVFVAVFLIVFIIAGPIILSNHYYGKFTKFNNTKKVELPKEKIFTPSYVETPDAVKGIYMTSWIASDPKLRNPLVKLIDTTELNSVVIDIKDYSGKVFFAHKPAPRPHR
jgi:hypothetical protein